MSERAARRTLEVVRDVTNAELTAQQQTFQALDQAAWSWSPLG